MPLARAVATGEMERGLAVCGSGVGACVAANKVAGVRAPLDQRLLLRPPGSGRRQHEHYVPGGAGHGLRPGPDLVRGFLGARFKGEETRFVRRLDKVAKLERTGPA